MTTDRPISNSNRAAYLNAIDEDYHDVQSDPYPLALASSLPAPPQPQDAQAQVAAPVSRAASTYGLLRDRDAAALLVRLLSGACDG
jgi:hypothetical protein